LVNLT